jgi:hypothetical protein
VLGLRASRLACFGAARARFPIPSSHVASARHTWLLESRRAGKRLVRFALARSR